MDKVIYLGGTITERALKSAELQTRLTKALTTAYKLKEFWKGCIAPLKWKLQVYNAVIVSQLIYGLNTIHLTDSCLQTLDTFQLRGLRQILRIEAAFFSGISHNKVLEKANIVMNSGDNLDITWEQFKTEKQGANVKIERLSILIKKKQNTLLGHLIRTDEQDGIMREVSIGTDPLKVSRVTASKRRVGRPRQNWVVETRNRVSLIFNEQPFDDNNALHHANLVTAATNRSF